MVLHRALLAARAADGEAWPPTSCGNWRSWMCRPGGTPRRPGAAGGHGSTPRGDPARLAGILAIRGMNEADQGRHADAADLLTRVRGHGPGGGRAGARRPGRRECWPARCCSPGRCEEARQAAEREHRQWRQRAVERVPALAAGAAGAVPGRGRAAGPRPRDDAEHAFALACELGDPCWEGMAGRALGLLALHAGDLGGRAGLDRRRPAPLRSGIGPLRLGLRLHRPGPAGSGQRPRGPGRDRPGCRPALRACAVRCDLPEFLAWALVYQAEAGDRGRAALARTAAAGVSNPALQARVQSLPVAR